MAKSNYTPKKCYYDVWNLDVWGNEDDGFDVNDRSCYWRAAEFPTVCTKYNVGTPNEFKNVWPSDAQILQTLKDIGFLKDSCKLADITIDGEHEQLFIEESNNGYPICQLEQVDNGGPY